MQNQPYVNLPKKPLNILIRNDYNFIAIISLLELQLLFRYFAKTEKNNVFQASTSLVHKRRG